MTISYWLNTATKFLQSKSIMTARLDALVLLEDTLKVDRAQLLAEPNLEMKDSAVAHLQKLLSRRAGHEPLAYIRGKAEFYGRTFVVNKHVLTPRPESETMIEVLKELVAAGTDSSKLAQTSTNNSKTLRIADVGAGSGALGITAAKELKNAQIDLIEIDGAAVKVAKTNVDLFTLNISVIQSDLLAQTNDNYDILLCNLPYVPDDYQINKAAAHEPKIALFGGADGLEVYRKLFKQVSDLSKRPLYILTEALPTQHIALHKLAEQQGYDLLKTEDFIQVFALSPHGT